MAELKLTKDERTMVLAARKRARWRKNYEHEGQQAKREGLRALFDSMPRSVSVEGFAWRDAHKQAHIGLIFRWSRKGIGFGELTLRAGADGKLVADTERMSQKFVLGVLAQALNEREAG